MCAAPSFSFFLYIISLVCFNFISISRVFYALGWKFTFFSSFACSFLQYTIYLFMKWYFHFLRCIHIKLCIEVVIGCGNGNGCWLGLKVYFVHGEKGEESFEDKQMMPFKILENSSHCCLANSFEYRVNEYFLIILLTFGDVDEFGEDLLRFFLRILINKFILTAEIQTKNDNQ